MGFKCGIVGLPNVGKSTLFNALTKAGIDSENYPFCTIEPNIGIVPVNDSRLQSLAKIARPEKILPTTMEFVILQVQLKAPQREKGLEINFSQISGKQMPYFMQFAVLKMTILSMYQGKLVRQMILISLILNQHQLTFLLQKKPIKKI